MEQKIPQHVAIVMDGNGRWAENRGLARVEGHRAGTKVVKAMVQNCLEKHIQFLSLFAFSSENWLRPEQEVSFLMSLFIDALEREIQSLHDNNVRLLFIGERERLSAELQEKMRQAEALTASNTALTLNVAVNYSGRWDLVQAAQKLAYQVAKGDFAPYAIDEEALNACLATANLPEPDLLIRTSGELRLSNFFLWQLAYTELYFTDVHWPDFDANEFDKALTSYRNRERRFGKTSKQLTEKTNYV